MIKIFHVPGTRSVRPIWLCYELALPVAVEPIDYSVEFRATKQWRSISPAGKVPAMIDGEVRMFESGAMVEYILERYGNGKLRPAPGTPESALHHQWCWFAEATLIRPLGLYRILRAGQQTTADLVSEAEAKFHESLQALEDALADRPFLLGDDFSAADIMMGYSVALIERLLDARHPHTREYLSRLTARAAYQQVLALPGHTSRG